MSDHIEVLAIYSFILTIMVAVMMMDAFCSKGRGLRQMGESIYKLICWPFNAICRSLLYICHMVEWVGTAIGMMILAAAMFPFSVLSFTER